MAKLGKQMTNDEIEYLAYEAMQREDFGLAERLFKSLEIGESDYALISLGWMHQNGYLGTQNSKLARTYFERALVLGSGNAHLQMAIILANENKLRESVEIIDKGMKIDNKECVNDLISLKSIVLDKIVDKKMERKNYKEAFIILQSQIKPQSEYTLSTLGWLYHTGVAGIKDNNLARFYFKGAGELGSIDALFQIGMIELGENNNEAARTVFEEGARLEHLPSISKLAEMMIEGKGGPIEVARGMDLLIYCAERCHFLSKIRLLRIEIYGTPNFFIRLFKRLRYLNILVELISNIVKGSQPSNYYEFR